MSVIGRTPWSSSERHYLLARYEESPVCSRPQALADEMNDLFHDGLRVRTAKAIQERWKVSKASIWLHDSVLFEQSSHLASS